MCSPMRLMLLLVLYGIDGFESSRTNSSVPFTNANNWYPSLLVLTTTAPPNASHEADWNDQVDPTVAETRSHSGDLNDELCVPDALSANSLEEPDARNDTAIRVASNCRTSIHKPSNVKIYGQKLNPTPSSLYSGRQNVTNNFISPQTVNLKTSPNGEITVINGKAVTPILYDSYERPPGMPQFERLMSPSKNYIVTKTSTTSDDAPANENKANHTDNEDGEEGEEGDEEAEEEENTEKGKEGDDKGKTKDDVDLKKDAQPANQYNQPSSTSTTTTTTSTTTSSTTTTARPTKFRFPTRRPDYHSKAKYGEKLGKSPGQNLPPTGKVNTAAATPITTRKPVASSTASPRYSHSVPKKVNAQIEALRMRYKQNKPGSKTPTNEPPPVSPTATPNKIIIENTTTTTTTTESMLKYELDHSHDQKEGESAKSKPNNDVNNHIDHNEIKPTPPKYISNTPKSVPDKTTDRPSFSYDNALPTDTTKKQIPEPNNVRYQMQPLTTSTTARPRANKWSGYHSVVTPSYRFVHQSTPLPPYQMKMSLPNNAYYTPIPTMELTRLNAVSQNAGMHRPQSTAFPDEMPSPYPSAFPSRHASPMPPPMPSPLPTPHIPESVPELNYQHYFVQGKPSEQYSHVRPTPTTPSPKPEVFVTIENQFIIMRNKTPIIHEEISLPPSSETNHFEEQQMQNKFNNVILDPSYSGKNKPYKAHQHPAEGHSPPMPPQHYAEQPVAPTYSTNNFRQYQVTTESRPVPPTATLNQPHLTKNPAEMYFYYEQNHQPRYNYRLVHSPGSQASPTSLSQTSSTAALLDQFTFSPEFTRQLNAITDMDQSMITSPHATYNSLATNSYGSKLRSPMSVSTKPLINSQRAPLISEPAIPTSQMTLSYAPENEPTMTPSRAPLSINHQLSPKMNMYKPIEIHPNKATPIVYGEALSSQHQASPTAQPNLPTSSSSQAPTQHTRPKQNIDHKMPQMSFSMTPNRPEPMGNNNAPSTSNQGAPFTLVRHYVRTYAYDDNNPRPTSIEFDNQLNVEMKDMRQIPSISSNFVPAAPTQTSSQYFGMPRSKLMSDDNQPGRYLTRSPQPTTLPSSKPTHQAIVLNLDMPHGPTNQPLSSQQYKVNLDDMSMLANLNRPQPSQASMTRHQSFLPMTNKPEPNSDMSAIFMRNSDMYTRPNILPIETTIYESQPSQPLRTEKLIFSDNLNKPPMLTLDSTVRSKQQFHFQQQMRPNRPMVKPMEKPMERPMSKPMAMDRQPNSEMFRPLREQRPHENDIMDGSSAESQITEMMKPSMDPFEEFYNDKILPLNAMIDYSGVVWNTDESNRVNLLHPNETQSSGQGLSIDNSYPNGEVRPTVKSKLKDALFSMFNDAKANNQSQSQYYSNGPTAQSTHGNPMRSPPENANPFFENAPQSPSFPISNAGFLGQLGPLKPKPSQDLQQSMSSLLLWHLKPSMSQPEMAQSSGAPETEMLHTAQPTIDNRFRRNQRILNSLKTIFGLANPSYALPTVNTFTTVRLNY